jgi:ribose transport system permease protein
MTTTTVAPPEVETVTRRKRTPAERASIVGQRYGLVGIWALLIVVFGALRPDTFLTLGNFQSLFDSQSLLMFLSLGLVISLVSGDFNLALPGVFSTSLLVIGTLNGEHGVPWPLAVLAGLGVAFAVGVVIALLVVKLRLSSFIVTLGLGTALFGVAFAISNDAIAGLSTGYDNLATTQIFGLQSIFFFAVLATALVWYVYRFTPVGRKLYFVGASREVGRLAGLDVDRLRMGSLIASTTMAGVAAVLGGGYLGVADPSVGQTFLLPMFASTLLGSTVINPGRPNPWGTFVATYFLVTGYAGLGQLGLTGWIEEVFYGSALVLAVVVSTLIARRTGGSEAPQIDAS